MSVGYVCQCSVGFLGDRCEGKIGDCDTVPCYNEGTCLENRYTAGYTCVCSDMYTGIQCENRLDGCLLQPCQNAGTCLSTESGKTVITPS